MAPINASGSDLSGATANGNDVQEITIDGSTLWEHGVTPIGDPIHWWPMDEGSGATITDNVGSANGSLSGGYTWNSNNIWTGEHSITTDGTGYANVGQIDPPWGSNWTVAFTIQTTNGGKFFGMFDNSYSTHQSLGIQMSNDWDPDNNSGAIQFYSRGGGSGSADSVQTNNNYDDGNKHRVVIRGDDLSVSNLEIYVDDTRDDYVNRNDSSHNDINVSKDFYIFEQYDRGTFDGTLDNFVIWNTYLSRSEITQDYNDQPWT